MIDHLAFDRRLILVEAKFSSILTQQDVRMFYSFVRCSVPTSVRYHEFIDYSDCVSHDLDISVLSEAAENEFRKRETRDSAAKTAFITADQIMIDMINQFAEMSNSLNREACIFPDVVRAKEWLFADNV